jgi:hypothetical protein
MTFRNHAHIRGWRILHNSSHTRLPLAVSASAIANSPIQLATLTSMTPAPISRQPATTSAPAASSSASTVPTAPTNAVVKFYPGRVKKLLKLPDVPTIIIGAIIATIFGVPTWLSLRLAVWTSTKDFYELCLEKKVHVTSETIGVVADISGKVHIHRREA